MQLPLGSLRFRSAVCVLVTAFLLPVLIGVPAAAQEKEPPSTEAPSTEPQPDLSEIFAASSELAKRQSDLQLGLATLFQPSSVSDELKEQTELVESLAQKLEAVKASSAYSYDQIADFRAALEARSSALARLAGRATEALNWLENARSGWLTEKARWKSWRASLDGVRSGEVRAAFQRADHTIESALQDLSRVQEPLLEFQAKVGELTTRVQSLETAAQDFLLTRRQALFTKSSPSMFSPAYFREFRVKDLTEFFENVGLGRLLGSLSLERHGWLLIAYLLAVGILASRLHRKRQVIGNLDRGRFLAKRPIAASLLAATAVLGMLPQRMPGLLLFLIAASAAARLAKGLFEDVWRRRVVYLLVLLTLLTQAFLVFALPLPLFRLYLLVMAAVGLPFCLWRARINAAEGLPRWRVWLYQAWAVLLVVSALASIGGYASLAIHVFGASLHTTLAALFFWMLSLIAHGGVQYGLSETSFLGRMPLVRRNARRIRKRAETAISALAGVLCLAYILGIWGVYESGRVAVIGLFDLGVTIGSYRLTLGLVLGAALALYGSLLISWALQDVLLHEVYPRRKVQWGVRFSINRLIQYALVLIGFLVAIGILGVNLQNITILAGALGVGIGFGLQNVVNNFVSGLILLFERPVKVGDIVQLGQEWGTISRIGLRATIVQTFDMSEIIVPNSELVSTQVTNWTLGNRSSRVIVPVGVAYGSDVPLAMKILKEVAEANELVLKDPEPLVLFQAFGSSSLDFDLRVWVADVDNRLTARSQLHQEIDRRFREAQVEIAFPQRDLHLRTVDEEAWKALAPVSGRAPDVPATAGEGD